MASPKKNHNKKDKREKTIPISDEGEHDLTAEPLQRVLHSEQNRHYELHIEAGGDPTKAASVKKEPLKSQAKKRSPKHAGELKKGRLPVDKALTDKPKHKSAFRLPRKVWNLLEWLAVSALIFAVLFFAINFSSYSQLLKNKLEKVTGGFKLDPYIEKIVGEDEPTVEQEPLPPVTDNDSFKQQIPPLALDVAPPDDRIIIPRINKNVPVVGVSSENLIKRDWSALESDIQGALRDGVVHYPGTAQPGDRGNVVITGHSSYFPWDPGRFKDVFALLHEIIIGDQVIVFHDQEKYTYEVYDTEVVTPDKVEVLTQQGEDRLTLITCTPVGTNLKRLIVYAKPV